MFLKGRFKTDFNARFAKPARESQALWRPLPKNLMSIGSAASAIKRPSATIMRFASVASSWTSPPARVVVGPQKLVSRYANSLMDAGACITTTLGSWRQRLLHSKQR